MARPSLKAEKTEHILQAYEHCIGKYGVEGATLKKVAEEAGIARPLLRHYVGNQQDLLSKSIERYFTRQQKNTIDPQKIKSVEELLDFLFDQKYLAKPDTAYTLTNDIMIASAFTLEAQHSPIIKEKIKNWFEQLKINLYTLLSNLFPHKKTCTIKAASTGIIGIYFNFYAMKHIDDTTEFIEQSKLSIEIILQSLQN